MRAARSRSAGQVVCCVAAPANFAYVFPASASASPVQFLLLLPLFFVAAPDAAVCTCVRLCPYLCFPACGLAVTFQLQRKLEPFLTPFFAYSAVDCCECAHGQLNSACMLARFNGRTDEMIDRTANEWTGFLASRLTGRGTLD